MEKVKMSEDYYVVAQQMQGSIYKLEQQLYSKTQQLKEAELELVEVKNTLLKLTKENCKLKQLLLEDDEL